MDLVESKSVFAAVQTELEKRANGEDHPESYSDIRSQAVTLEHLYEAQKAAWVAAHDNIAFTLKMDNSPLKVSMGFSVKAGFATIDWTLSAPHRKTGELIAIASYEQQVVPFLRPALEIVFRAKSGLDAADDFATFVGAHYSEYISVVDIRVKGPPLDEKHGEEVKSEPEPSLVPEPEPQVSQEKVSLPEFKDVLSRLVSNHSITLGDKPASAIRAAPTHDSLGIEVEKEAPVVDQSDAVAGSPIAVDWLALGKERYANDKIHQRLWDVYAIATQRLSLNVSRVVKDKGSSSGFNVRVMPSLFIVTDAKHLIETQFEEIVNGADGQLMLSMHPLLGVSKEDAVHESVQVTDQKTREVLVLDNPASFVFLLVLAHKEASKTIELHKGVLFTNEVDVRVKQELESISYDLLRSFGDVSKLHRADAIESSPVPGEEKFVHEVKNADPAPKTAGVAPVGKTIAGAGPGFLFGKLPAANRGWKFSTFQPGNVNNKKDFSSIGSSETGFVDFTSTIDKSVSMAVSSRRNRRKGR